LCKKKVVSEAYEPFTFPINNALLDFSGDKYLTTEDEQNYLSTE